MATKEQELNYLERVRKGEIKNRKVLVETNKIMVMVSDKAIHSVFKKEDGARIGSYSINGNQAIIFPTNGFSTTNSIDDDKLKDIHKILIKALCNAYKFHGGK